MRLCLPRSRAGRPTRYPEDMCHRLPTALIRPLSAWFSLGWAVLITAPLLFAPLTGISPLSAQATATPITRVSALSNTEFARTISELSEAGGYFDTDNLISNERSYLHVMDQLDRLQVRGGAYIGVGPDQSYSYIARTRSELAFLLDIRRDNLLQHVLFKALFAEARTRAEYLALWLGRPVVFSVQRDAALSIDALLEQLERTPATNESRSAAQRAVRAQIARMGLSLSADDMATIARFHDTFMSQGLALRFTSIGRAPRPYYPTLRDLLRETDRAGRQANYLASEADFQYLKELHHRNLIIPIVGDLAGPKAVAGAGRFVRERGLVVSVLYASNAEDYVMRDGGFARYVQNVASLPRASNSVMIRSWFGGPGTHPHEVPGYFSVQLLQTMDAFMQASKADVQWGYRALVFSPHVVP